jgi:2,4-dienoyl-CoA reductase-like NADH-dependent reductase (Old Yellow Enzyme family)
LSVFEPITLGGVELRNRVLRSATHEGMADSAGAPTPKLTKKYLQYVRGEVGAIITGYASVMPSGDSPLPGMLKIHDDALIPAHRTMVDAIHAKGTSIILQIAHCGRQTRRKVTGHHPVAPSAIRNRIFSEDLPHALTDAEIDDVIEAFVAAIGRAKEAGYDGVQLHIAHGYLLNEFFSAHSNHRSDRWGGSVKNRFRIVGEILARARAKHPEYPIFAKMSAHDGRKRGMHIEESLEFGKLLQEAGCSALEVSCGIVEDGLYTTRGVTPTKAAFRYSAKFKKIPRIFRPIVRLLAWLFLSSPKPVREYNVPAAARLKEVLSIPIIVVGGIRSIDRIEAILGAGHADAVALSRALVAQPVIVKQFRTGAASESNCVECNICVIAIEEEPLRCYHGVVPPEAKRLKALPAGSKKELT